MIFDNTFNAGDIVALLGFIAVIIGGLFSLHQYRKNLVLKRADYIMVLTEKIRSDVEISSVIYIIDYDKPWYDDKFHGGSEIERKVDKTLSYFSYICYLREQNLLSQKEFETFEYCLDRILTNVQVIDYLYNLYHFTQKLSDQMSFKYLFEYGEKRNYFYADFYAKNAFKSNDLYHKRINIGDDENESSYICPLFIG